MTPNHDADESATTETTSSTKKGVGIAAIVVLVFVVLVVLYGVFSPSKEDRAAEKAKEKDEQVKKESPSVKYTLEKKTIHIEFTGEYGKFYEFDGGYSIDYQNATVPYCRNNRLNHYVCSDGTENITGKIADDGYNNRFMQFKSSDGESVGSVDVILTPNGK